MGTEQGLKVTALANLGELDPMKVSSRYDGIVLDYYLDGISSYLTGPDLALALESVPILLVSQTDNCLDANEGWGSGIRMFLNKKVGVPEILDAAQRLIQNNVPRLQTKEL